MAVRRVVSGGQTGVDRAALDVARELDLPIEGWCPKGRLAENGPIPDEYPLRETATADVAVRTELNVLHSDGTLVLSVGNPQDGTVLTRVCAEHHGKPLLVLDMEMSIAPEQFVSWIQANRITTLNVGGPRESYRQGFVYTKAYAVLSTLLRAVHVARTTANSDRYLV